MSRKHVVVTGYASVTPLGLSADESWNNLLSGKSGIAPITQFDTSGYDSTIAGEVKGFNPTDFGIDAKQARRMDRFTQFAVAAGNDLMKHSRLLIDDNNAERVEVILGVGLGGLQTIENHHTKLCEAGPGRISPFSIPMLIPNMAAGQISIATKARGANIVLNTACASATHAIGVAYSDILLGRADAVITGGVEACIRPMGVSGFTALKALCSDHNNDPEHASRPFDLHRSGFVIAEGAGLIMLESLESAKVRGATVYAEIIGYGASADAFHMTAPEETGRGMALAMSNAIRDAGISPADVDHINAHGTSTHLNDLCETRALKSVFGSKAYELAVCSTKAQTGHTLGAAGGIEAVFTIQTLQTGIVPATANYTTPDPECDLNYMGTGSKQLNPVVAMSNSFGFGGTNASIIFAKI